MENQNSNNSTWFTHGWNMARSLEYGDVKQQTYANSEFERMAEGRYSHNPIVEENCNQFISGWEKAMMN